MPASAGCRTKQIRRGPRGEREPRGKNPNARKATHAVCEEPGISWQDILYDMQGGISEDMMIRLAHTFWEPPSPQKVCRQGGSIQRNAAVRNMSYGIVWSSGADHVPMELNRVQWRQDRS
jgi:hypothetical protein